ncbi:MAG: hypothetical protein IJZ55_03560 [Lachnospiraceae bacterium]|nr:hypothetical protein [Lachnospiraceae bacterium]
MNPETLKTLPEYQKLSPAKQALISEIVKDAGNTSGDAMLPLLLKAQSRMKAQNIQFTPEESSFLMTTLMSGLSPAEKAKFELLKKFMKK